MKNSSTCFLIILASFVITSTSYRIHKTDNNIRHISTLYSLHARETNKDSNNIGEQYSNPITKLLGQFIPKSSTNIPNPKQPLTKSTSSSGIKNGSNSNNNKIQYKSVDEMNINWDIKKRSKSNLSTLIQSLEKELKEKEWFVTGNVNPSYFSDDFRFQDPDVKIKGIQQYARGVNKIFVQNDETHAEIISIVENNNNNFINTAKNSSTINNISKAPTALSIGKKTAANTNIKPTTSKNTLSKAMTSKTPVTTNCRRITITWRLTGRVNIGPNGLPIKPYLIFTDYDVDETTGLIVFQEDRFSIPGYDILLSALFPVLITWGVLSPPCPPVDELKKNKLY